MDNQKKEKTMEVVTYKKQGKGKVNLRRAIAGMMCHESVINASIVNIIDFRKVDVLEIKGQSAKVIECADVIHNANGVIVDITQVDSELSEEIFELLKRTSKIVSTNKKLMQRGKSLARSLTGKKRLGNSTVKLNPIGATMQAGGKYISFLGLGDEDECYVL